MKRAVGIEQCQHRNLFSLCLELMGHLKRYQASKRSARQIVRPIRLHRSDFFEVVGRHFFDLRQGRRDAVEAQCLKRIHRLLSTEMISEWSIYQNVRPRSVNAEEGRL